MDTMQSLQREGVFWLPDNPTRKVGGRLTFDPQDGLQLQLFGSLQGVKELELGDTMPICIHGTTTQGQVTLDNCYLANAQIIGNDVTAATFHPALMLDGEHTNNAESLRFERAQVGLFNLSEWIWESGITREHANSQSSSVGRVDKIIYTPPENQYITAEFGQLVLTQKVESTQRGTRRFSLQTTRLIQLAFSEPTPIDRITSIAGSLQDMLTVCIGQPSAVESIAVAMPNSQQYIGIVRNMIGPETQNLKDSHPAEMWLTFKDVGGLDFIRQWLVVNARYGIVARLLVDHTYNKNTYVDIRFLNTVIAAETLLRVRTNTKEVMLREGLQQLAEESGTVASDLVGDINSWAEKIRTTRNALVHRDVVVGKRPDYFALAESVYWIVVMSMLRECGVPDMALSKVRNTSWFEHTRSSLRWP